MKFKYILIGIGLAIILYGGGLLTGRFCYPQKEIKVVEKKVYETKWKTKLVYKDNKPEFTQENFDTAVGCMHSPINFKERTETEYSWFFFRHNYFYVTAFDDCKENMARYEVGQKGNYRMYILWGFVGALLVGGGTYYFNR